MLKIWRRPRHSGPGSVLTIGDAITVRVLDVDTLTGRVLIGVDAPAQLPILRDGLPASKVDKYCQRSQLAGGADRA